jgi:predicted permease
MKRRRREEQLEQDILAHIDAETRENIARGMPAEEARHAAVRRFGNMTAIKEDTRRTWRWMGLEQFAADARYGLRMLRKSRSFTAVAVLSLALAIGADTAIFSIMNSVLLRPLPYPDANRLIMLWQDNRRFGVHEDLTSYPNFMDWKKSRSFADMAGFVPDDTVVDAAEPLRVEAPYATANLFSVLGVTPMMGRTFLPEEEAPARGAVVVLSYAFWKTHFGGDSGAVGKTIRIDQKPCTIIGVMPEGFAFPSKAGQLWRPMPVSERMRANRGGYFLSVVGRLKAGVPVPQARAEMDTIGARLARQYPDSNHDLGITVVPLLDQIAGTARRALAILLAAVGLVLLIACGNVANLFLARGAARMREMAVRAALGAARSRIARQLLVEMSLVAALAGGAGFLLGFAALRGLLHAAPQDFPRLDEIGIDYRVLLFTTAVSAASIFLFGLVPALRISRADPHEALREGGRTLAGGVRSTRTRDALMIAEVALAMVLLAGAGLMIRSFARLRAVDPGFQPENVLTMRVSASQSQYRQSEQAVEFYQELIGRLDAVKGIHSAGVVGNIFLSTTPDSASFTLEGHPLPPGDRDVEATLDPVSDGYLQTMGVPLRRGRFFNGRDTKDSTRVVLINETMARRYWPNEDPVGKRMRFSGDKDSWMTVAGVVGDMRRQGLDKPARLETFQPLTQWPARGLTLVVRTEGDPLAQIAAVRSVIRSIDKAAVVYQIQTLEEQIGESLAQRRFQMLLLFGLALLALLLAAAGVYGITHYTVTERTHEIGVRMALGASREDVMWAVARSAVQLALVGATIGTAAAFALTRALASALYDTSPHDPWTYAGVFLGLMLAATAASAIPARRATRLDPMQALRYE